MTAATDRAAQLAATQALTAATLSNTQAVRVQTIAMTALVDALARAADASEGMNAILLAEANGAPEAPAEADPAAQDAAAARYMDGSLIGDDETPP